MRVWALASCGGLLALAACSSDQANTANPNTPPADGDTLSQGKASPSTTTPRPLARPEIPPQQTLAAQPRLNPVAVRGGADRTASQPQPQPQPQLQLQADQLRARLQRLREQQGIRLASITPVAAAPIPTTARVVASPIPRTGAPTLIQANSTPEASRAPGARRDSRLAIVQPPSVVPLLPLATPTPLASPQPPETRANVESGGTAADLRPVVAATLASNYPIAPLRHQGQSARQGMRQGARSASPQLVPPPTSQPFATSARLHGSTAPALAIQPRDGSTAPVAGGEATLVPDSTQAAAEDQNLGSIALPESLPLNSAAPRLSPQRPRLSVSPSANFVGADSPGGDAPEAVTDRATPEPVTPEPATPAASTVALHPPEPFVAPSEGHLSPIDRDSFHLVPSASQSPKGLPLAQCPPAQPSFSVHNQSMTLDKDAPLAHCGSQTPAQSVALEPIPVADPAPDHLDFSAASVADLDLDVLPTDPDSY